MPKKKPYTVVTAIFHGDQDPVELKAYSRTGALNAVTRLARTYANVKGLFFDDDRGRNLFSIENGKVIFVGTFMAIVTSDVPVSEDIVIEPKK